MYIHMKTQTANETYRNKISCTSNPRYLGASDGKKKERAIHLFIGLAQFEVR
jgi:hypothetical protein